MKYAIYDKAADGYLTKLEFEHDVPVQTLGLICGYNEYITEAKLLDTKEETVAVITRIESNKFVGKGRFVMHSFDDTLNDQYIISEAGNPTKVVDNITVDLDGNVNVKYGTMACHWSTISLDDAIDRMNALQKAVSAIYTPWNDTFMVYEVITIMDEKEHTHYQFMNRTITGLVKAEHDEEEKLLVAGNEIINTTSLLNKRIEGLELANYNLVEMKTLVEGCANRLQAENDKLKIKVESIKKEARDWKNLYESADEQRTILKDVIDIIYTDLKSETTCNDLKDTLRLLEHNPDFDHIYMPTKVSCILDDKDFLTAKDEIRSIINKMITIIESRDLNQSITFSSAEEAAKVKDITEKIIDICDSNDSFCTQFYKFLKLYETIDDISKITNSSFMIVFNKFLALMSTANKEIEKLRDIRISLAEVIYAIRNAIYHNDSDAFCCIENRMKIDPDFNSGPFMADVRENIKDICLAEKKNIANHDLKNSELAKAAEKIEKLKGMLNSMYGYYSTDDAYIDYCLNDIKLITGRRCCGKQLMADILSGKKIPVDKKKYDDLLECVNNISLTYEMTKLTPFSMDRPSWLSGIINRINDLTK